MSQTDQDKASAAHGKIIAEAKGRELSDVELDGVAGGTSSNNQAQTSTMVTGGVVPSTPNLDPC